MFYTMEDKGIKFYIKSISYVYDNEFMTEKQIMEMWQDVRDCSGELFEMFYELDDLEIEEIVRWLVKNRYVRRVLVI